ncbi:MAG TPA: type-F conjugative transfer system secretin TraK [Planctomycetota bacterium]|nr:type-F conjugative transfer system secretin TraK [Planctomycetota bacterium]
MLSFPPARVAGLLAALLLQEPSPAGVPEGGSPPSASPPASSRTVEWKEGVTIPVRVPVAKPGRELMTTLSFPEDSIDTAITGWQEGEITAIQKRGLLFLRMVKRSEGQLNVIGGSGTHYLLFLQGVAADDDAAYDAYLKIRKKEAAGAVLGLPQRPVRRPSGAVELLQAMRLGRRPEGLRIFRAKRELALESPSLEIRLLYVYDGTSYRGYLYEVKNWSSLRQALDASQLGGKGPALVLSSFRENVLDPGSVTRLYVITWKD